MLLGYAGGNNSIVKKDSGITYSGIYKSVSNFYGNIISEKTSMYYPVFLPRTYAYNYINIGDSYNLAKNLNKLGNPYGLNKDKIDSHQMKNSEWGAIAYLAHSQYGLDGEDIYINNISLENTIETIYAVTGYAGTGAEERENITTITALNGGTSNSYAWNTVERSESK